MLSLKRRDVHSNKPRESQMKIDSETIPSPPSTVHRETYIIPVDPISSVDMVKDITIGHKRPT
jgi:hypothetical protein